MSSFVNWILITDVPYKSCLLGFEKSSATTRDVEGIYLDYGHDLNEIYDLKLEEDRK